MRNHVFSASDLSQFPEADRRLTNWGRWARGSHHRGRCFSAEGRYLAEAGEVWQEEPRPLPVDERDALAVDRLVGRLRPAGRVAVTAWYVRHIGPRQAWPSDLLRKFRAAGVSRSLFGVLLVASVRELSVALG